MEKFDDDMKHFLIFLLVPALWIAPVSFLFSYLFRAWLGANLGFGLGAIVAGLVSYPLARKAGIKFPFWLALSLLVALLVIFHDWLPNFSSEEVYAPF